MIFRLFPFWEFSISLRLPCIQTDSPKRQKIFRAGSCRFFLAGVERHLSRTVFGHLDRAKWIVIGHACVDSWTRVALRCLSFHFRRNTFRLPFFDRHRRSLVTVLLPVVASPSAHPGGCASPQQTLRRSTCSAPARRARAAPWRASTRPGPRERPRRVVRPHVRVRRRHREREQEHSVGCRRCDPLGSVEGRSAEAMPSPPSISATPVHAT